MFFGRRLFFCAKTVYFLGRTVFFLEKIRVFLGKKQKTFCLKLGFFGVNWAVLNKNSVFFGRS